MSLTTYVISTMAEDSHQNQIQIIKSNTFSSVMELLTNDDVFKFNTKDDVVVFCKILLNTANINYRFSVLENGVE